jgi:hypothetical protein
MKSKGMRIERAILALVASVGTSIAGLLTFFVGAVGNAG